MPTTTRSLREAKNRSIGRKDFVKKGAFVLRGTEPVYQRRLTAAQYARIAKSKAAAELRLAKSRAAARAAGPQRECENKFLTAMVNPFSAYARGACLPASPSKDSFKYTQTMSGILSTATGAIAGQTGTDGGTGFGYIFVSPINCNNSVAIYASNSNTPTAHIPDPTVADTHHSMNGPFAAALMLDGNHSKQNSISSRVLSVGLRIRYIGRQEDAGGRVYGYVDPSHQNVANGVSMSKIGERSEVIKFQNPGSGRWLSIKAHAAVAEELEYPQEHSGGDIGAKNQVRLLYPWSNDKVIEGTMTTHGAAPMGLWIKTPLGDQSFEYEVVMHCEAVGDAAAQMVTQNYIDPNRNVLRQGQAAAQEENNRARAQEDTPVGGGGKRAGYTFPGYNYLGPGNPLDGKPPVNNLDNLAMVHDIAYDNAMHIHPKDRPSFIRKADVDFIGSAVKEGPIGVAAAAAISAKYGAERLFGSMYP